MKIECGCHCIKCGNTDLESNQIGEVEEDGYFDMHHTCKSCLLYTSPSPRDAHESRMPSSA